MREGGRARVSVSERAGEEEGAMDTVLWLGLSDPRSQEEFGKFRQSILWDLKLYYDYH